MKKLWVLLLVLCMGIPMEMQAQNFDEEFNTFVKQNEQKFNQFVDSINRQFAEAMEANMRAFNGEQPKVRDPKPKPVKLPEVKTDDVPELPVVKPQPQWEPLPDVDPLQPDRPTNPELERPSLPDMGLPEPARPSSSTPAVDQINMLAVNLFGLHTQIPKESFPDRLGGIETKNVADFWIRLSECEYEEMMQACREAQKNSAFNDWAICQMVLEFARKNYEGQYNEQAVMAVFLLNQLGMEAKVGFTQNHLFCLVAVEQQLYGVSFADIGGIRYYLFELDPLYKHNDEPVSFRTYDMHFPRETHSLDMNLSQPLKSEKASVDKEEGIHIDMNMIELFKTYPQVEMDVYANATPSKMFCQSVEQTFRPYLKELSTYDAVSFILAFMQYGFDYATDDEQFGYEKPFFCEENFYYPKNDCEDRSILFSFLVRHLLHLEVVLIDYPGHIATAVHFPTDVKGESVEYKGKEYVICDPTYIGASIGMEMPDFTPSDRTVIPLNKW